MPVPLLELAIVDDDGVGQFLRQARMALVFTTMRGGRIGLIHANRGGGVLLRQIAAGHCTGLAARRGFLWVACDQEVRRLDRPTGVSTSDCNVHDIAAGRSGRILFANTGHNCAGSLGRKGWTLEWRPPFALPGRGDACHLNGLAVDRGRLRFVTVFARSGQTGGWRAGPIGAGSVIDADTGKDVAEGLTYPHSPRLSGDTLWVLDSGTGILGRVGRNGFEPVAELDGFARGLAVVDQWAIVGISDVRRDGEWRDIPVLDRLRPGGRLIDPGLAVVDLRTGRIAHRVTLTVFGDEIYDVLAVPEALAVSPAWQPQL